MTPAEIGTLVTGLIIFGAGCWVGWKFGYAHGRLKGQEDCYANSNV